MGGKEFAGRCRLLGTSFFLYRVFYGQLTPEHTCLYREYFLFIKKAKLVYANFAFLSASKAKDRAAPELAIKDMAIISAELFHSSIQTPSFNLTSYPKFTIALFYCQKRLYFLNIQFSSLVYAFSNAIHTQFVIKNLKQQFLAFFTSGTLLFLNSSFNIF